MAVVYQAINLINGKRYIGISSRGLRQRRSEHISVARCTDSKTVPFHRALRKYGSDMFRFSVVATCDNFDDARRMEVRLIKEWAPYYNATEGGSGNLGLRHTPESRAKISAAARGRKGTFTGRKHSEETRRLISEKNRGHVMPPQTRLAVKAAFRAYLTAHVMRPVRCSTDGRVFPSATEASRAFGWKDYVVANAVGKTGGRCRGLHFEYLGAADGGRS